MSRILHVFLENEAALKRYLKRFCGGVEDVSEMAQEAFLRAFAAEQKYEISEHRAFLFKIAKNVALTELRKKNPLRSSATEENAPIELIVDEDQPTADEWLDGRRKLRLFAKAVAELPPQCRKAFLLRHVDGLKYKQIANRMNISVSAVEKHMATALVRCRLYLCAQGYEPSEFGSLNAKLKKPSSSDSSKG